MRDFGFLLCDQDAWEGAAKESAQVKSVKDKLFVVATKDKDRKVVVDSDLNRIVSWREFFGACKSVANYTRDRSVPVEAFDVDLHATAETISCLFLEVWLSEIAAGRNKIPPTMDTQQFLEWVSERHFGKVPGTDRDYGLAIMVRRYRAELFRAWLLLGEFITQARFPSENLHFTLPPQSGRPRAAAARHWYSTASIAYRKLGTGVAADSSSGGGSLIPTRLPGRFSVRGDWDLAIAKGSLSTRLGERALDLLSSRRAQIERLRNGLGLPTRDVTDKIQLQNAWTCLWTKKEGRPKRLHYYQLNSLGATTYPHNTKNPHFAWLWRSSLKDYNRTSRFWVIWLCSMRERWQAIRRRAFPDAADGLAAYDAFMKEGLRSFTAGNDRYKEFFERCEYLIDNLKRIT